MAGRLGDPLNWLRGHIPRDLGQLEATMMSLLRAVFWGALLAPVALLPAYYLLVSFGLAPQIHLPG
ncbi:MAG: hypothetical protein JRN24_02915 [Nitrososphaerota archaeon]|nr:hypothetical protein [Nitrososphaerota archaeon]